jgi:hypothetical protein
MLLATIWAGRLMFEQPLIKLTGADLSEVMNSTDFQCELVCSIRHKLWHTACSFGGLFNCIFFREVLKIFFTSFHCTNGLMNN